MRGSRKNGERVEQVRKDKKGPTRVEPLRPKSEQPDKLYNDLAKFPSENPYPVLRIHRDGMVLYANKAGEPLLKARGSGVGQPAPSEWHQLVKKALSSGKVIREETEHDGRVFAFRAVPIADRDYVNFYGVDITLQKEAVEALRETKEHLEIRVKERTAELEQVNRALQAEIAERKQAEEAVKRERQRLDDVLETLPAYVVLLSADYHVPFANRFFRERFGESEGRRCYEYLFHRSAPCESCETYKVLKTASTHRWEWAGPDGRNYDIFDFPFTDEDGAPLILEVGIDITERKRAKEVLQQAHNELEQRVAERTEELRRANEDLRTEITERKKAEQALHFTRFALDNAVDTMVCVSQDARLIDVNDAFCRSVGYSREELLSMTAHDIDPNYSDKIWPEFWEKLKQSGSLTFESCHRTKDGKVFPVECTVTFFKYNGKEYHCGFARDITERKRAEETLRESEGKYRGLVENSPNIVAIYQEGALKYVNQIMCEKLGWTFQEMTSPSFNPVEKIIPQRFQSLVKENIAKRLRGENIPPYEISIKTRDGSEIPVIVNAQAILYHGKPADEVIHTDITERKRAEEALRSSENKYRTLLENLPQKIFLKDRNSVYISCNENYAGDLTIKAPDIAGKTDYDFYPKELADKYRADDKRIMEEDKTEEFEEEYLQEGEKRWVHTVKTPVKDPHGNLIGILGIFWDVTERKQAEHKLLEYQKQLKRLAAQLALAEERERRRIAGELHDQVGQSLALAKIKLDALRASATSRPAENVLAEVSETMQQLIDKTRSLTFDLSNPILYELGFETAVSEWLNEQVHDKQGIATEFADDGLDKPLDDDVRVLLFRNVRELLINVIKYANADRVKVGIQKIKDSIEVTVEDNGVGFDPIEVRSMAAKRTEFGLLSVRESLEELGGRFEIESKPGAGCKAVMTAPLKSQTRKKEE